MTRRRLFAGQKLRELRKAQGMRQAELAEKLQISPPYLSQLESDQRPITLPLLTRLSDIFPLDWQDVGADSTERLAVALKEAAEDPLLSDMPPEESPTRLAEHYPHFARSFVTMQAAYRQVSQRLAMADDAYSSNRVGDEQLPWEEVRDWFHLTNNYIDILDRSAEELSHRISGEYGSLSNEALNHFLSQATGISTSYSEGALREFRPDTSQLSIDPRQPPESMRFQLAHQLVAVALASEIESVVEQAQFDNPVSQKLLLVGLRNYAAGSLLMPYSQFRAEARAMRHDIDRLRVQFGTSFEQACHRLSNLQRPGERGLPVFFCRVDMAGNITKRHSATRLQFARFGGACPLWIVHEAVAIPDRILVQLAETTDGVRYVSMAKGLVKPSDSFLRPPRRYALALGCEASDAADFIYADGIDTSSERLVTKIGVSCRICSRTDCDQRAFPPSDQRIEIDPDRRSIVPYYFRKPKD